MESLSEKADRIGHHLLGTCSAVTTELQEELDNDPKLAAAVEEITFCCNRCGWWCENGEQAFDEDGEDVEDGPVCQDCYDEEH